MRIDFIIARLMNGWKVCVDVCVAWAILIVIIDDARGLKMRINCGRTQKLKTAFFQIKTDFFGQAV